MLSSMNVKGLAELDKALAGIGATAGGRALVAALKDAAQPVHSDMQANAPEDTGDMKESIKMRAKKGKGQGKTSAKVSVGTHKNTFMLPLLPNLAHSIKALSRLYALPLKRIGLRAFQFLNMP